MMAIAMMTPTSKNVTMMVEIAVDLASIQIIVQTALALVMYLVMVQLLMAIVMMKPTMFTATMTALTVVDLLLIQKFAQTAHAMVS